LLQTFARPIRSSGSSLLVKIVASDTKLASRLTRALGEAGGFHVEMAGKRLSELATDPDRAAMASLQVLQIDPDSSGDLEALERIRRASPTPPPTIVLADSLTDATARRLLKLQVTDWLTTGCTDGEFVSACEQAVRFPAQVAAEHARCTTFVSALGGAGATTLSLAAASVFARRNRTGLAQCCVADLNFQAGALADYLDLTPNLQLGDVAASPDRLDRQLLEVMLTRHASELAILAAPPSLNENAAIGPELIGRLLDLASQQFKHVIIDLPRHSLPLCENVVRGTDTLFIVTELTVAGLRQARRLADMLEHSGQIDTKGAIIVNKVRWLGGGVSKRHAREVLGDRLAGFVSDCANLVQGAQNRGQLLSQIKRRNRIESDLEQVLNRSEPK